MPREGSWQPLTDEERERAERWKQEPAAPPTAAEVVLPEQTAAKWQADATPDPDAELPPVDESWRRLDHHRARGALHGLVAAEAHAGGDGRLAREMLNVARGLVNARRYDATQVPQPAETSTIDSTARALVRAVAIGVLLGGMPERRWLASLEDASGVSGDVVDRLTASALAAAIAAAVREGPHPVGEVVAAARSEVETASLVLAHADAGTTTQIESALAAIRRALDNAPTPDAHAATTTLRYAIRALLDETPFETAITRGSELTLQLRAAIRGALLGAYRGRAAIPDEWLRDVDAATGVREIYDELSIGMFVDMPTHVG